MSIFRRPPDFVIGTPDAPYLRRWWVIPRNRWFNIYLHQFLRSDDDRALHSHPWAWNVSILLRGSYAEHTPRGIVRRRAGCIKPRWGEAWHRVELDHGTCWTLFLTGPVVRQWGFACPQGFVHWRAFTKRGSKGEVGPGCGQ